jgi:hypothetical protein
MPSLYLAGIRELFRKTCPGAAYDSQSHRQTPLCYQATEGLVVKEVFDWIDRRQTKICWIYGAPTTGKSSIALAIAAQCAERGVKLGASFFANGSHPHVAPTHLIPSIAYQLAISNPESRTWLGEAIERDASILHKPLETQIQELILTSLFPNSNEPESSFSRPPILVIIDGLDQCFNIYHQHWIAGFMRSIANAEALPIVWLITSRPEHQIRRSFDVISSHVHAISLSTIDRKMEVHHRVSIPTYLRHRFNEIYERYPLIMQILLRVLFMGLFMTAIAFLGSI